MKSKLVAMCIVALLIGGCKTTEEESFSNNQPIVSPDKISSETQTSDAPVFPTWFQPWWKGN